MPTKSDKNAAIAEVVMGTTGAGLPPTMQTIERALATARAAKSAPTKIEEIDLTYQFYQRQVNPLMGTIVGDIIVDSEGDAEITDAKGVSVPEGGSYFRKGEIKFKLLSLSGKQRRLIEQAEDAISAAQAPLFAVLATAPKSDVLEVAQQLMGAAGGKVDYEVIEQVQAARENQMQQQHLQAKATESASTVSDISRTERAEVQKWTEIRAAVLWGIPTTDLELIRDFPGAYGVTTEVGFMADWLQHTEYLVTQIQNFQKEAVA
jgi:hypothetical protein